MKKEKRLKKFNISNRLAYTLMVILSIALLGIGVYAYNPAVFGHNAADLNLDWGSVQSCIGSVYSCSYYDYDETQCWDQNGCSYGCSGGEFSLTCGMAYDYQGCQALGCNWDSFSNSCGGYVNTPMNCNYLSVEDCQNYRLSPYSPAISLPCYLGCSGIPNSCSSFSPNSECTNQGGCSISTAYNRITNSSRGLVIPNLNVGLLCSENGANCVSVRGSQPSAPGTFTNGDDSTRRMRVNQWTGCPSGSYVSSLRVEAYSDSTSMVKVSCTPLPIR